MLIPHWFIEERDNDYDLATQNIIYAIQEMGMPLSVRKYVRDMTYEFLPIDQPVIVIGCINCIRTS